jgi:hypothetical protein
LIICRETVKLCREAPTMLGNSASKAAGKLSRKTDDEKKETKLKIKLNPERKVRKVKKNITKKTRKNLQNIKGKRK